MKYFLLLLIICSCGKKPEIPHYINHDFDKFIEMFKEDAQKENASSDSFNKITVIDYDDNMTSRSEIGSCNYEHSYEKEFDIKIYDDFWREMHFSRYMNQYSELKQYKLFLHEIGHCVYHLRHNENDMNAIMYPEITEPKDDFDLEKHQFFLDALNNRSHWNDDSPI